MFNPLKMTLALGLLVAALTENVLAEKLQVTQTEQTIVVSRGEQTVLTYNKVSPPVPDGIDKIYQRSGCLHPVCSPKGQVVTAMFPADHPHQHGIFTAWVKTTYQKKPVDFWNLARGTGRVLHERVVSTSEENGQAAFEVDLIHRKVSEPAVDILRERWKVTVHPTDGDYHCFDLELTQTALTDKPLMVKKYHYGGVALRGPTQWVIPKTDEAAGAEKPATEPSSFLNNLGSGRAEGNHQHAKWVALTGLREGKPVTITVLSHPSNFRAPQAARLHPAKPYFAYSPCVDDAFAIDRDHPFRGRYRYLITDAAPEAAWLDQQWKTWAGE